MNVKNRTQGGLVTILLVLIAIPVYGATTYEAFSLRAAERLFQKGTQRTKVRALGDIGKVVAVVYDESRGDIVLVGEKVKGEQVGSMDELVVGLRAVLKYGQSPEVSIDRTADTERTNKQLVRFEGGIGNTRFGEYLLDADIILKKLGLGKLQAEAYGIHSYFDMCVKDWQQTGQGQGIQSRFVFIPDKERSYAASRAGVGMIKALEIKVQTEVTGLPGQCEGSHAPDGTRDEVGDQFASAITAALENMCGHYKELNRLDALFRLTGVAEILKKWRTKDGMDMPCLEYWLDRYPIKTKKTPETYCLLASEAWQGPKGSRRRMVISGGVELRSLVRDIRDGSLTALKDLVVKCRPSEDALTWPVPLGSALDETEVSINRADDVEHARRSSRYGTLGTTLRREFSGVKTSGTPQRQWNTKQGVPSSKDNGYQAIPGSGIGNTNSGLGVTGRYAYPSMPKPALPLLPKYEMPRIYTPPQMYKPPTIYVPPMPKYQPMNVTVPKPMYSPRPSFRK